MRNIALVKLNKNNYSTFTEDIFVIKKRNGYIKTSQKIVLQKFQLKSNFSTLKLAFFFTKDSMLEQTYGKVQARRVPRKPLFTCSKRSVN